MAALADLLVLRFVSRSHVVHIRRWLLTSTLTSWLPQSTALIKANIMSASPVPASRPIRRRVETRAHLLRTAEAMFAETGSTSLSVEAIVTRAGFTRGAFYSNFRTVDELFFAVYEKQAEEVLRRLTVALKESLVTDADASLGDSVRVVLERLPPEQEWFAIRSVLLNRARHNLEIATMLRAHTDQFHDALQPVLVSAIEHAGRTLTVSPAVFTRAVVAAHIGAILQGVVYEASMIVRLTAVQGVALGLTKPNSP